MNIRHSSHYPFRSNDPWAYGYNPPTIQAAGGAVNTAAIARAKGDGFTQFLREAADVAHSRGKRLGVHILWDEFRLRDDTGKLLQYALVEWQWEKWIREIVDYAEFRGMMGFTEDAARHMADSVVLACRQAGKPFILQCNRRVVRFEGPLHEWEREMSWAFAHSDIDAYQFYETAYFTRMNDRRELQWNPAVAEIIARSRQKAGE